MNKIIRIGLIVILAMSLFATATAQRPSTPPASGILYRISGKALANPSYVFGTLHLTCPGDMFSAEKLGTFIEGTDRVVLEIDMDDPTETAAALKGLLLPAGKTIRNFLQPEQFAATGEFLKKTLGVEPEQVQSLSPFALQVLVMRAPAIIGCAAPSSYEELIMKLASERKREIEGLETAAFQISVINRIPLEAQAKSLYAMAANPDVVAVMVKELQKAYHTQDSDFLYKFSTQMFVNDLGNSSAMLDDRNKNWIPKLEVMMKAKSSFIAVGGAHLGGKNGVIAQLRALGYTVEPIRL